MNSQSNDVVLKRISFVLVGAVLLMLGVLLVILNFYSGQGLLRWLGSIFAGEANNTSWMITRSAGIIAYLLLWLATIWDFAVSSKLFDPLLERLFTFDLHEFLSLLALAFTAVHIVILLFDTYEPFSAPPLFIPFISNYRPLWVGLGIIGLYLFALVTVTFYIRKRIGYSTFRMIHYASYALFALVLVHGIFSGADSPLWTTRAAVCVHRVERRLSYNLPCGVGNDQQRDCTRQAE